MSFSANSSSREAIQAIQFELWPDCNGHCKFCYLNGTKRVTTKKEKIENINSTIKTLKNPDLMRKYNAVGLIGGEFFAGQIKGIETEFTALIDLLNSMLCLREIKEVWITSSLLFDHNDLDKTISILNRFNFDELAEDQRIILCTSYDTIGRFDFDIGEETDSEDEVNAEQAWRNNLKALYNRFPKLTLHTQTILTEDVIEKLIENPDYFDFITRYSMLDFRYPSITRADCPTATVIEDYRSIMMSRLDKFPEHFFIEKRNKFLKCLKVLAEKYGLEKVKNLIHQPEMRSRRLIIYVEGAEIEDRWNDDRNVYLECGHLVDGLCYVDSDDKCIYCDIEKFIENQENI